MLFKVSTVMLRRSLQGTAISSNIHPPNTVSAENASSKSGALNIIHTPNCFVNTFLRNLSKLFDLTQSGFMHLPLYV